MKINKYIPFGIILIVFGAMLFFLSGIDQFIRPFTQPILMGSSKGKDILFFVLLGITIIISTLGDNEKIYGYFKNLHIPEMLKDKDFYLKLSLILLLFTAIAGIVMEFYLRNSLGIDWNTILVIMNPSETSTSILHSHLYKGFKCLHSRFDWIALHIDSYHISIYDHFNAKEKSSTKNLLSSYKHNRHNWTHRWGIICNSNSWRNLWNTHIDV